jgi:HEAT repeat protein
MPRRTARLLILTIVLGVLVPAEAHGLWITRTFFELLQSADDVLVVRVDSTGGPQFGQWAQVSVRRSLKGTVSRDTIRLPFEYQNRPSPGRGGRVWMSTALDRSFEAGQRLLVLVARSPLPDTTGRTRRWSPYGAATRYRIYPYPSDTRFDLNQTDAPMLWATERLVRADRAETAAAQADALRPLLTHANDRVRRYGAGAARELSPNPLAPLLLRRFAREDNQRVRRLVTETLARLEHPDITPTLLDAVPEYEPALQALERRADPAAREPLMELYETIPDTAASETVQDLLWAIESHVTPADLPRLRRWYLSAASADRREPLLHLIAATRSEQALTFLGNVLASWDPLSLRIEVAEMAERDSLHALAPTLLRRFEAEPNPEVRRALTNALSPLDHPDITPTLLDAAPTYRPALRALGRRTDTTLAPSLLRLYETVADTAGPRTMRAFRSVLPPHLSDEHAPVLVRWYEQAETPAQRRSLLSLIGPLKTPTSDSLLAAVVRDGETETLRLVAAQLLGKHGTRHPEALAHALQHDDHRRVREAALRALGHAGHVSTLDAIVNYAPPPCAVTDGPGFFTSAWQTVAGWMGQDRRSEAPWSPTLFEALRRIGRQADAAGRSSVRDAVASYLSCSRFEEVRLFAAKTLFTIGPSAARPILRDRLRQEPSARLRKEIRHLLWTSAQIDES